MSSSSLQLSFTVSLSCIATLHKAAEIKKLIIDYLLLLKIKLWITATIFKFSATWGQNNYQHMIFQFIYFFAISTQMHNIQCREMKCSSSWTMLQQKQTLRHYKTTNTTQTHHTVLRVKVSTLSSSHLNVNIVQFIFFSVSKLGNLGKSVVKFTWLKFSNKLVSSWMAVAWTALLFPLV